jgi:hypothetical protein
VATPVAKAKADAECPDGNDVERGIATVARERRPAPCVSPVVESGRLLEASVGLTSAIVNVVLKPLGGRRRPDRDTHQASELRRSPRRRRGRAG